MSRRFPSLVILPAALVLASCGGGGDGKSEEAKPYVDAMSTSMTEEDSFPGDEKQATCFSEGFVDIVGIDKVKKMGTPKEFAEDNTNMEFDDLDLTRDQGEKLYDQFGECDMDMREMLLAEVDDEDTTDEVKACLEEELTDDIVKDFFVTTMLDGEEALETSPAGSKLTQALMGCMMGDMGEMGEDTSPE